MTKFYVWLVLRDVDLALVDNRTAERVSGHGTEWKRSADDVGDEKLTKAEKRFKIMVSALASEQNYHCIAHCS